MCSKSLLTMSVKKNQVAATGLRPNTVLHRNANKLLYIQRRGPNF